MDLLIVSIVALILLFGFVLIFGAPYLPSHSAPIQNALDLLSLQKGQRLLELGAGDGKVSLAALKRGYNVTAIELNPILCVVIWARTRKYRSNITIKCGNFWTTSWGEYNAIYTFLLDKYMTKLDNKIIQENKNVKLASYVFTIPGRKAQAEKNGVFLYRYNKIGKK